MRFKHICQPLEKHDTYESTIYHWKSLFRSYTMCTYIVCCIYALIICLNHLCAYSFNQPTYRSTKRYYIDVLFLLLLVFLLNRTQFNLKNYQRFSNGSISILLWNKFSSSSFCYFLMLCAIIENWSNEKYSHFLW